MIIALLGKPRGWKSFRRPCAASTTGICRPGGSDGIGLASNRGIRGLNPKNQELCDWVQVRGKPGALAFQPSAF